MIPDFMNPVTFWSGHHLNDIKRVLQFVFDIDMNLILSKTFKKQAGDKQVPVLNGCILLPSLLILSLSHNLQESAGGSKEL